jgi:hypothetical protein
MKLSTLPFSFFVLFVTAMFTTQGHANPATDLVAAGSLSIDNTLSPSSNAVPGQKIQLTLIIATDHWFTGGSQITIPEVPGLIILQNEKFANNASETRNGQTWVIQRWTLDVFPQRAGDFTVPPLEVLVKVNGGDSGNVEGTLHSKAITFSVSIPSGLKGVNDWLAAPAYEVRQYFDRELDKLVVGDAFEQVIVWEASDVMAMMLPGYTAQPQAGLAAYPAPVELENKTNRGQALASRTLRISYVVETPGTYTLPEHDYYWWNTSAGELQMLSLEQTKIEVAGQAASSEANAWVPTFSLRQLLAFAVGIVGIAVLLKLLSKLWPLLPLDAISHAWAEIVTVVRSLRKPALAQRLNPGSNAED